MTGISTTRRLLRALPSASGLAGHGILLLIAVGLGVLAAAGAPAFGASGRAGIVAGVLLVLLAAAPTAWRLRVDYLDAPGVYAVTSVFFFGLTSLAWLGSPNDPGPGLSRQDVARALLVVALGLAVFGIGARLTGSPQRTSMARLERPRAPSRTTLVIAYLVALAGVVLSLALHVYSYLATPTASSQLSGILEVLNFLASLGGIVVLVTALTFFATQDTALRAPLIAFVVIQTIFGVVSGVKGTALEAIVFVLLAYMVCRGRVPWKAIGVTVAVALLVLVPLNTVYRQNLRGGVASPTAALSDAINSLQSPTTVSTLSPLTYVLTRFRSIDDVALILSQTPSPYPFANGATYSELPALITVPRFLWPSKPALTQEGDFSHSYWQIPESIGTASPITQIGDLYRNFALAGIVLGMLLWGIVVGLWGRLRRRWTSPVFTVVYLYALLWYVTYVESDLPELIATAVKILPLVALVAWIVIPKDIGRRTEESKAAMEPPPSAAARGARDGH